ncbi:intracellular protein transport protein USO1 isoform X5 [Solanum lycopersicum]|uniref:intracellular protein transport protein USO1 isoform X5 n=2 Tax=Solanum lycopersicum TaxID=4081 RepID=UPI000E1DFCAF|nr:reticulocyte-binding protein 2 homolog a isoform X4 [Solanum lycopersicum]
MPWMSVDGEFANGSSILTDEKLPEVANPAIACEIASSSGTAVSTKEILNCPADKGQMEHNPASEITGIEEMSGKSGGSEKGNDDEKLRNISAEAANTGCSGEKIQCDQSVKTENADTDGDQGELSMVAEIKGVNERGGDFDGGVNLICEESANADKVESNGQKVCSTEIKAVEEIMGESNGSWKNDKSVDAEKGDINNSMDIDPVTETMVSMEGMRGESTGPHRSNDGRRLSEESADIEKLESNGQRKPITVTEIKAVEEISGESNGSSKNDKSVDDGKGGINSSMAINPVTETVRMEETRGESSGPHRSNDNKRLNEESAGAEKVVSSEDKSLSDQLENAGSEDSKKQLAPNMITKIKGISEIGGNSNCDVKLVREGSVDAVKIEINGQRAPSTVTEIGEIRSESNGSSKIDERADAEKASGNNSMATKIVTEISALEGQSNGAEKINIISEITGMDVESNGAEEIGNDELVHQESTNIEKAESQGQKISHIVSEIKEIEDIEGESDVANKRTDGNSTSEDRKDDEVANNSTPVHKGIDAVTSGKESVNSLHDDVQNVCNTVFDTKSNDEIGSKFDGDNIDDKAVHERDEDSERLRFDSLASEGMSSDAELSHGPSVLADARLSEVDTSFTSFSRDMSSNDAVALGNEATDSRISHGQSPADMVQEIIGKAVGSESNDVDRSSNDKLMCEDFEDDKSFNYSSPAAEGVHSDAEFSIDQSVLADVKLCKAGNSSASSIKDECRDVVCGSTLNDPIRECKMVPDMATEFSDIKKEGESSVADQTSDDKFIHESVDAEKPPSISIDERMSCNDESSQDQATIADLELSEAGNTSSGRDVSSFDAMTLENETLTCPIEIDQESANTSIEIAGSEEMTGGSDRSNDDELKCEQSGNAEISKTNEVLASSAECSSVDVAAVKDINQIAAKGFYFLIRMPRFDDEKIRECIKVAEQNVDEKTQQRDAFRQKIRNKRANCQTHGTEFEAAKAQERDARKQVRTKRADISSLQDIIDKAKNAVAVTEIDNRICNMEHIIGHETVPLKEEKLLIREIKQLKQLRGQLSSNIGSQDEVQKSLDEREVNEERLRALKKELDSLKVKVSKAETIAMAASRKFEDESRKLKELQAQFKAADDVRQEAYEELRNLKKGLYEKNIHFRTYKDEATLASDHARKREMETLNHLCVDQVERYMDLWNKNDEFRKDYIRCNTRSTVRRFGTLDGRSLGPDEEPAVLPSYRLERVNRMVSSVDKVSSMSQRPVSQLVKQVVVLKDEINDDSIVVPAAEGMKQVEKTKEARKPIQRESTVEEPKEAEPVQTAEELEAARKEEELRKREEEARLKEQRRLEEIAKAKEALERKKRNAEKAQLRAEMRAQKEEEQRLKEKEKKLRKRERKKGSVGETQSETNDGEAALISTSLRETVKEPDATENSQTLTRRKQKSSQYTKQMKTKSIPPPPRIKGKRKWQQWLWLFLSCAVVIALFFLGNIGFFSHLKPPKNPAY